MVPHLCKYRAIESLLGFTFCLSGYFGSKFLTSRERSSCQLGQSIWEYFTL